jgi:ComF family protein
MPYNWQKYGRRGLGLDLCTICGTNSERNVPVCRSCMANMPRFSASEHRAELSIEGINSIWTPFRYAYPLDRLITAAKFHGDMTAMSALSYLMAMAAKESEIVTSSELIPVPLHWLRLVRRGFNQAGLLAEAVGTELGVRIAHDTGTRHRRTTAQATLGAAGRRSNLGAAFRAAAQKIAAEVSIIDDVVTTGATAQAFAAALRDTGYTRINLWALARA